MHIRYTLINIYANLCLYIDIMCVHVYLYAVTSSMYCSVSCVSQSYSISFSNHSLSVEGRNEKKCPRYFSFAVIMGKGRYF